MFGRVRVVHLELGMNICKPVASTNIKPLTKLNQTLRPVSRSAAAAQREPYRALAMASVTGPLGSGPSRDIPIFCATCCGDEWLSAQRYDDLLGTYLYGGTQ